LFLPDERKRREKQSKGMMREKKESENIIVTKTSRVSYHLKNKWRWALRA